MPRDRPLTALAVASSRTRRDTHSTAGVGARVRDAHKQTVRMKPLPLIRMAFSLRGETSAWIADHGSTVLPIPCATADFKVGMESSSAMIRGSILTCSSAASSTRRDPFLPLGNTRSMRARSRMGIGSGTRL